MCCPTINKNSDPFLWHVPPGQPCLLSHYNDIAGRSWPHKSPITWLFIQQLVQANNTQNKLRMTGPLWGKSTSDQWIPLTKGQWWRKYFHVMTSSWLVLSHHIEKKFTILSNSWKKLSVKFQANKRCHSFMILIQVLNNKCDLYMDMHICIYAYDVQMY